MHRENDEEIQTQEVLRPLQLMVPEAGLRVLLLPQDGGHMPAPLHHEGRLFALSIHPIYVRLSRDEV